MFLSTHRLLFSKMDFSSVYNKWRSLKQMRSFLDFIFFQSFYFYNNRALIGLTSLD